MKWAKSDQKLSKFMKLWTFINCLKWINYSYKQINCRMEWLWAHETQLDDLVSIFPWKPLILQQLLLSHWSDKGQYAIVFNWNSLLSYQLILIAEIYSLNQKKGLQQVKINHVLYCILCVWSYWRKKLTCLFWYMTHWMFVKKVFLYFYNVLGENQYFPFEAPPKSGFWCLFFNFSFCCIVGLSFLQLAIKQFKQFAPDIA